jgi:hypothetical protein
MTKEAPRWLEKALEKEAGQRKPEKERSRSLETQRIEHEIKMVEQIWEKLDIDGLLNDLTGYLGRDLNPKKIEVLTKLGTTYPILEFVRNFRWPSAFDMEYTVYFDSYISTTTTKEIHVSGADIQDHYDTTEEVTNVNFAIKVQKNKITLKTDKHSKDIHHPKRIKSAEDFRDKVAQFLVEDSRIPKKTQTSAQ